jgi:hypothetical protein
LLPVISLNITRPEKRMTIKLLLLVFSVICSTRVVVVIVDSGVEMPLLRELMADALMLLSELISLLIPKMV